MLNMSVEDWIKLLYEKHFVDSRLNKLDEEPVSISHVNLLVPAALEGRSIQKDF